MPEPRCGVFFSSTLQYSTPKIAPPLSVPYSEVLYTLCTFIQRTLPHYTHYPPSSGRLIINYLVLAPEGAPYRWESALPQSLDACSASNISVRTTTSAPNSRVQGSTTCAAYSHTGHQ